MGSRVCGFAALALLALTDLEGAEAYQRDLLALLQGLGDDIEGSADSLVSVFLVRPALAATAAISSTLVIVCTSKCFYTKGGRLHREQVPPLDVFLLRGAHKRIVRALQRPVRGRRPRRGPGRQRHSSRRPRACSAPALPGAAVCSAAAAAASFLRRSRRDCGAMALRPLVQLGGAHERGIARGTASRSAASVTRPFSLVLSSSQSFMPSAPGAGPKMCG